MCLILFAWKTHANNDLVLAANRDEFYNRPTKPATEWMNHPNIIAGQDLTAGGTWLGITKSGRFAALTNYRDPSNIDPNAPSRGQLTKEYLVSDISPEAYLDKTKKDNLPYNDFNLLVGDEDSLWYYNNVNNEIISLSPGIYGLSNALLNDPWPKVKNGQTELANILSNEAVSTQELLSLVQNKSLSPDNELPNTGVPLDWERALSAMFITMDGYGTRCSTALIRSKEKLQFVEKSYPHVGQKEEQVEFIL